MKIDTDLLYRFENGLNPQRIERSRIPASILGYGEISTIFRIEGDNRTAFKRMPLFSNQQSAEDYVLLYREYTHRLSEAGLSLPDHDAVIINIPRRPVVVFIAQERLPSDRFGHKRIQTGNHELCMRLIEQLALEVVVQLLSDHGQGGICGYKNRKMVYHNSYIIADPDRAWVLETAGPMWAASRIKENYSISNGLTIGESFEESHPDLITAAKKKGWLKRGEVFNFARCYSDWFYTTFSASRKRKSRSFQLLNASLGVLAPRVAMGILRDHDTSAYRPGGHLLQDRLCAHAANSLTRDSAQSTGSLIAHLTSELQTYWATGTSAPCTGIFKPLWFNERVLPDIGPEPGGTHDSRCLWWFHEELHRAVLEDYEHRMSLFGEERNALEDRFLETATDQHREKQYEFSVAAFEEARIKTGQWIRRVKAAEVRSRENRLYRRYWKKQNSLMP
jgi:secernin